ncbi:MAG: lipid II flippase MurJ [bacterium]
MTAAVERAARAVMLLQAAGLALGVLTQALVAHRFGTGADLSAFTVAAAVVSFLADWFLRDAVLMALVPPLRAARTDAAEGAHTARACRIAASFLAGSVAVTLALAVGAAPLVHALAPGLAPEESRRAAKLLVALLPALPLAAFASCLQAELQAQARFTRPAAAALARSAALAVAVLCAASSMGIYALPLGVVGGYALATVLQGSAWPSVRRWLRPAAARGGSESWLAALAPVAGMLALGAAGHVNLLTDRWFVSRLPSQALPQLGYAERFRFPIMALFAISVSGPALTYLSEAAIRRDWDQARRTVRAAAGLVARTALPALVVMWLARRDLVAIWLERGAFSPADTAEVAAVLARLIPAFAVNAFSPLVIAAFFALGRTRELVGVVAVEMVANAVLDAWWVEPFGLIGVAWATTVATLAANVVLWRLLVRELGGIGPLPLRTTVRVVGTLLVLALAVRGVLVVGADWHTLARVVSVAALGVAALGLDWWLGQAGSRSAARH